MVPDRPYSSGRVSPVGSSSLYDSGRGNSFHRSYDLNYGLCWGLVRVPMSSGGNDTNGGCQKATAHKAYGQDMSMQYIYIYVYRYECVCICMYRHPWWLPVA